MTFNRSAPMEELTSPLHLGKIDLIDKRDWILKKVTGKSILHVGPTDSPCTRTHARLGRLLHVALQGKCKELIGLDLDKAAIEIMREECQITDTQYGNAEELDKLFPAGRFDAIIAGAVVAHMSNIGLFFLCARKVLKPGGELIITVPNAFSIKRLLGAVLLRQERNNPDHLYFFSAMTLRQAARRFGYDLTEVSSFMYNAPECGLNARGTPIARMLIHILNNNYLADELAVVMNPTAEKL